MLFIINSLTPKGQDTDNTLRVHYPIVARDVSARLRSLMVELGKR